MTMPLDERRQRWKAMFDYLCAHDVTQWRRSYLQALREARAEGRFDAHLDTAAPRATGAGDWQERRSVGDRRSGAERRGSHAAPR
jgi:hypothetical protein